MVLSILRALAPGVRRDIHSFGALKTNNFFLFVALLHAPNWLQDPGNRIGLTIALRERTASRSASMATSRPILLR